MEKSCKLKVHPSLDQLLLLLSFMCNNSSKMTTYLLTFTYIIASTHKKLRSVSAIKLPPAIPQVQTVEFHSTSFWKLRPFTRISELSTSIRA